MIDGEIKDVIVAQKYQEQQEPQPEIKPEPKPKKKFNWKNLFKMEKSSAVFMIILFFLIFATWHDMRLLRNIISNPRDFCQQQFPTTIFPFPTPISSSNLSNLTIGNLSLPV